jgi:cell volume regulation protein A
MVEELLEHGALLTLGVGALLAFTVLIAWVARRARLPAPLAFLAVGVAFSSITGITLDSAHGDWLVTIGTLALSVILFEGGFHGGWSSTRIALGPILALGIVGTFITAASMAALGHYLLGLGWATAALIGVALAPTDPATVFSVLGGQTLRGRAGEVLEGESGVNDPVGIALMLGVLQIVQHGGGDGAVLDVATTFVVQLGVGIIGGVVIGLAGNWVLTHAPLPSRAVHASAAFAVGMVALGITSLLHGSGFLAAFMAGLVVGEQRIRHHQETEESLSIVANLGETSMFLLLGLTITFEAFDDSVVIELATFALLTLLVRPVVTFVLLTPSTLTRAEQGFIAWGGLRGAVPILLGFFVLVDDVPDSQLVYTVVFVAVTLSMLIQGVTLPRVGRRLGLLDESDAA